MTRRSFLTATGATLLAAGLLAVPPATAYAHTTDAYVLTTDSAPNFDTDSLDDQLESVGAFRIARADLSNASLTRLPEEYPLLAGFLTRGFEIVDETGYAVGGAVLESGYGGAALLFTWDHVTGAVGSDSPIPLILSEEVLAPSGVFSEFAEADIVYAAELDAQSDGSLLTVVVVRAYTAEGSDDGTDFLFIGSVDPEGDGTVTLLESIDPTAYLVPQLAVGGLATDPTDGTTYLLANAFELGDAPGALQMTAVITEVDLDPSDLALAAGTFDVEDATFTSSGVDTATVVPADFTPINVSAFAEGPFTMVLGADFTDSGELWFAALTGEAQDTPEAAAETESAHLVSMAAPFSVDAPATSVGELVLAGTDSPGYFPGLLGTQPAFAVESAAPTDPAELPETGAASAAAPLAALGAALVGGVLLLLGPRRTRTASA